MVESISYEGTTTRSELTLSTSDDGRSSGECAGDPVSSSRKTTPRLKISEDGVRTPVSWYSGSI